MKLTVIEHKHWVVDYVVELKERIPDQNEYGSDQMGYYAGHATGLFLPRDFFDHLCDYWRECVRIANEGGRCILNPEGADNKCFALLVRRGHVRRLGGTTMAIENVRYAVGVAALSDYETYGELVDALNNPALAFWFDEEQAAYEKAITAAQEKPVTYTKVTRFQDGAAVGIPVFIICGSLTPQDFE